MKMNFSKSELVAIHKAIIFAKFPHNEDGRYEISGSTTLNSALSLIKEALEWDEELNLNDYPECISSIEETLIYYEKQELTTEIKLELFDAIIFPFNIDSKLKTKLLKIMGV